MFVKTLWAAAAVAGFGLIGQGAQAAPAGDAASAATRAAQAEAARALPIEDGKDLAFARRGFIATLEDRQIRGADGAVAMDLDMLAFAKGEAPSSVHPSAWRHAQLLAQHGLFQVTEGLYQVRGFDISNMSVIEGRTGRIIVDPLTTVEAARAAMQLVERELGARPVVAVIYTHSHGDHFGGVKGVVSEADVAAGKTQILAPDGFLEHAVSENLIAGPAMGRRAVYQFGTGLAAGPEGLIGGGIGPALSRGSISLLPPTRTIARTGETAVIDGVRFEFQITPGTEAPAEMNFYLPDLKALCLAENANATMHNALPPRGALARDVRAWADYLTESIALYGARTELVFTSHTWPRWGQAEVRDYVEKHRDAYKFLHDQTVRLMNQGYLPAEIAERLALPPTLAGEWYNRGYYGTLEHNSKAIYQRYLGWYDGNPATFNAHPPEEAAKRYVQAFGGARAALAIAQRAHDSGDYRWAAEVARHIVFAFPDMAAARALLAQAFTQMGFQAESMIWRNLYLTGAMEARSGPASGPQAGLSFDMIANTPTDMLLAVMATRIDPAKAGDARARVALVFPDRKERRVLELRNATLVALGDAPGPVDATLTLPRAAFLGLAFQGMDLGALIGAGAAQTAGDAAAAQALFAALDPPGSAPFAIVTP